MNKTYFDLNIMYIWCVIIKKLEVTYYDFL